MSTVTARTVTGFNIQPDGRMLCRHCSEPADCTERGHDYTPRPGGHAMTTPTSARRCNHCGGWSEHRLISLGGE